MAAVKKVENKFEQKWLRQWKSYTLQVCNEN